MLNDTSYIATTAVKYLALLYGGTVEKRIHEDKKGKQRIFIVPSQATARLRRLWGLDGVKANGQLLGPNILKDPEKKAELESKGKGYRADHRHHAVDGFVVANCTPSIIKQWAAEEEKRDFHRIQSAEKYRMDLLPPYGDKGTYDTVCKAVERIIVSHRGDHRVAGGLHDEKPSKKELKENCKVQIPATKRSVIDRNYKSGDNHRIEVYEIISKKGEKKWDVEVVSLYTAHQYLRFGKPTVNPDCRKNFLFALHKGDCVKIYKNALDKQADQNGEVFKIVGLNEKGIVKIQHHADARPWSSEFTKEYQEHYNTVIRPSLPSLKDRLVPVTVDVLGNVFPQN